MSQRPLPDQIADGLELLSAFEVATKTPQTNPPELEDPLAAIADIAKLSKAHATKLAVACKPPFSSDLVSPLFAESLKVAGAPMAGAFSAASCTLAKLVFVELKKLVSNYYACLHAFYSEIRVLAQSPDPDSVSSARLVTTAELWHACDQLAAAPTTLTPPRIIAQKTKLYCDTITDAAEELSEAAAGNLDEGYNSDDSPDFVVLDGSVDEPLDDSVAKDFDSLVNKTSKLTLEQKSQENNVSLDIMASYAKALELIPQAIKTSILFLLRKKDTKPQDYDTLHSYFKVLVAHVDDLVAYSTYQPDETEAIQSTKDIVKELENINTLTGASTDLSEIKSNLHL